MKSTKTSRVRSVALMRGLCAPVRVVVGRDIRLTSATLCEALTQGLLESGVDVIDIGLCGTEGVYFATAAGDDEGAFSGGIMVTASHNPPDYNGMKFVREGSRPISADTGLREMAAMIREDRLPPRAGEPGGGPGGVGGVLLGVGGLVLAVLAGGGGGGKKPANGEKDAKKVSSKRGVGFDGVTRKKVTVSFPGARGDDGAPSDAKKKAEEARKKAEAQKKAEEAKKKAEEAKRKSEALKKAEDAKKRAAEAAKKAEQQRKTEQAKRAAERAKKAEAAKKAERERR